MKLFAIETAVAPGSIAAFDTDSDEASIRGARLPSGERTARSLAPALDELLRGLNWTAGDLDAVAVTIGPGSFTGLRLGVTTAKTLAYAAGAACVPINTLAVLAAQAPAGSTGWAVLDAQRRELFAARFDAVDEVVIVGEDEWLAQLESGDTVIGPTVERLRNRLPAGVSVAEDGVPRAETVASLAAASNQSVTPFELAPNYYRLSAAEEKLLKE